ncbi:MAG: chloride channel protein, partial [Sutterella sp.]
VNWYYLVFPVIGILLTMLFVRYVVRDNISHGITRILYAFSSKQGRLPSHNMWTSVVASAITIGFGGSVGAEAPIVLTGSAIGSNLAQRFRLDNKTIFMLVGCGASAAIAGIFKAPIAGLVFTDRLRILNAIAVAQASIYFRAVKACDSFRRWFEKYNVYPQSRNQLKEASRLQPGITRKKETGTFELRWYRRKFSFNAEKEDGEFGDVKGRYYYFVRTPVGRMRVRVSMEYLKRGTELRYPPSTFRNEPEWAVQAELDLENTFAFLRNEQKRLSLIRAQLGYMKADQKKYFEAAFGKEVEAAFEELLQSEKDRLYRYDFSNDAVNYGKPWGIE